MQLYMYSMCSTDVYRQNVDQVTCVLTIVCVCVLLESTMLSGGSLNNKLAPAQRGGGSLSVSSMQQQQTAASSLPASRAGSDQVMKDMQAAERRKALQQVQSFLNPQNKPPVKTGDSKPALTPSGGAVAVVSTTVAANKAVDPVVDKTRDDKN